MINFLMWRGYNLVCMICWRTNYYQFHSQEPTVATSSKSRTETTITLFPSRTPTCSRTPKSTGRAILSALRNSLVKTSPSALPAQATINAWKAPYAAGSRLSPKHRCKTSWTTLLLLTLVCWWSLRPESTTTSAAGITISPTGVRRVRSKSFKETYWIRCDRTLI